MGVTSNKAIWEAESYDLELLHRTIGELIDQQTTLFADKEALTYHDPERQLKMRLTYRSLLDEVHRVAHGLLALGVERGEQIAIWAPNVPEWIFVQLALAKIGAALVTFKTAYRTTELESLLRQGEITTLFMVEQLHDTPYLDSVYAIVPELKTVLDPVNEVIQSTALPHLKRIILFGETSKPGCLLYEQIMELGRTVAEEIAQTRQVAIQLGSHPRSVLYRLRDMVRGNRFALG